MTTTTEQAPGRIVIVGDGEVSAALAAVSTTLGWRPAVLNDINAINDVMRELAAADSVVVLSHDGDVDGPALAAALVGPVGYVGAMGSRRTQQRRRDWLREHGVAAESIDSVHGPAGLALGADTPAEIAVAIAAEIIALRRARSEVVSLRDAPGPIHPELGPGEAYCPTG